MMSGPAMPAAFPLVQDGNLVDRANHYETAFAALLRQQKLGYIAVNESRRSLVDGEPVKSLDFIVYNSNGMGFLVDVKGRKFPGVAGDSPRRVWENWISADDLTGLRRWVLRFGRGYVGLFIFVYHLTEGIASENDHWETWIHRGKQYQLRAVALGDYEKFVRPRSSSWGTVDLAAHSFREVARPLRFFLEFPVPEVSVVNRPSGALS